MSAIQFRLAARTDAAGKYNADAPLEGNEDNMYIDTDLSNEKQSSFTGDAVVDLSEKGCLMVVADGMGGMNAGEVASAIAINTVMEYFHPDRLTEKEYKDTKSRIRYMEEVVVAADAAIKADSTSNADHEGMGSTIIMAWLCDDEICITWCGDSRAYLYRPSVGLYQVSKDHSYVQSLLDEGKINEIEAFDHPYGNIVTRSLGDPEKKAKPDSKNFKVYKDDIFMLCSDGLSGVLRDKKTYGNGVRIDTENLEDIISENRSTMLGCRDALFEAAERNDWYDNVTAILCEIVAGDEAPPKPFSQDVDSAIVTPLGSSSKYSKSHIVISKKTLPFLIMGLFVLLGVAGFLVWNFTKPKPMTEREFWATCQKNGNVDDYRAYLNKYPEGEWVDLAKNWIDKWVNDSIAKEKHNGDSIAKLQEERATGGATETENPRQIRNATPPKESTKGDNPIIVVEGPNSEESDSTVGLTPSKPRTIIPVKQPVVYKSPEDMSYEKAMSEDAVMEDCIEYLKNFPDGKYVNEVKNCFNSCIYRELQKCKTKSEVREMTKRYKKYRSVVGIREGVSPTDKDFIQKAQKQLDSLPE